MVDCTPSHFGVGTVTGLDYWTTGLTQTDKYTLFNAEQKLNIVVYSLSYFANTAP